MSDEPRTSRTRWFDFRTYVVASTTIIGALSLAAFAKASQKPRFQEIDVERINVVEPDGKLRMTISNSARSPGWVFRGKVYPGRPKGAGMIFFNDEGEEDGGFGFGGRRGPDGKVRASGGLAFDQYDQDESVTLRYSENDGQRQSGLSVTDRADVPIPVMLARRDSIRALPAGPTRDSAMKAFVENGGKPLQARRLFAGRETSGSAVLNLADPMGRPRLRMVVDSTGTASIQFLDPSGRITRTILAQDPPSR
jgi:hypothetical protein